MDLDKQKDQKPEDTEEGQENPSGERDDSDEPGFGLFYENVTTRAKEPVTVTQNTNKLEKMAKIGPPTADEAELVREMFTKLQTAEQKDAIIEALKAFQGDTKYEKEVQKITEQVEDAKVSEESGKFFGKDAKIANKFVQSIPKFGINSKVTWHEIVSHLKRIHQAGIYPDYEMNLMLYGVFEGPAAEYVQAHPEIFDGTFVKALAACDKVFGKTLSQSVHELTQITQNQGEKVEYFEARLINAVSRMKPEQPTLIKRATDPVTGVVKIVPNTNIHIEEAAYEGECKALEKLMLQQFLNGLRIDIKRQIKIDASLYTDLKEAVRQARAVEQFSEYSLGVNAVMATEMENENVNATMAYGRGRGRGRGRGQYIQDMENQPTPGTGFKGRGGIKNARCYRCGDKGHFSRECDSTVIKTVKPRSPSPNGARAMSPGKGRGTFKRKTVLRRPRNVRRGDPNCKECQKRKRSCSRHRRNFQGKRGYVNQTDAEADDEEEAGDEEYDEEVYEETIAYEDAKN